MKKLLSIVFLGLLLSGNAYAKNTYLSCENLIPHKVSIIINDKTKKLILSGVEREVVNWSRNFITFWQSDFDKKLSIKNNLFKPSVIDRITGTYDKYDCKVVDRAIF